MMLKRLISSFVLPNVLPIIGGIFLLGLIGTGIQTIRLGHSQTRAAKAEGELKWAREERRAFEVAIIDRTAEALTRDRENSKRVVLEQKLITQEVSNDLQGKLAHARAVADGMRREAKASNSGGEKADMPAAGGPERGLDEAASKDEFSINDRLIATEQALQLQALIDWVSKQSKIDQDDHDPDDSQP